MTREKAINIIRNIYQTDTEKEALQALIPELKESDGERIRKSIVHLLQVGGYMSPEDKTKAFAWLEKQKEQKPSCWNSPIMTNEMIMEKQKECLADDSKKLESDDERIRKEIIHHILYDANGVSEEQEHAWVSYLEKQKEQKKSLAEKFRPDELQENKAIEILEDYLKWAVNSEEECPYTWKELADAIRLGIDAMKEQNPVEHWQYVGGVDLDGEKEPNIPKPHKGDDTNPYDMSVSEAQEYAIKRGFGVPFNDGEVYVDERHITQTIGNILRWADEHPKEKKPNIELIQKSWYMEGYHDCKFGYEPKWIIKTGEGGPRSEENPKYGQHIEQKSAEWSKNDTVFLNEITDFFENKTGRLQHDLDMYAHWLKSLPERFNPQPKQEWSEEDKTIIEGACNALEVYGHTKLANKLKSLRPQPKQEWSEEDKLMIKCCLAAVKCYENTARRGDYLPAQFCIGGYLTTPEKVADWLRSLCSRPKSSDNWKPSEEQMKALDKAIPGCMGVAGPEEVAPLESLYTDLQKLL